MQRLLVCSVFAAAWTGHRGRTSSAESHLAVPVDQQSHLYRHLLVTRPHRSLDLYPPTTGSLEIPDVVDDSPRRGGGGATQRQTSTTTRPSSDIAWQSVHDISQSSHSRVLQSSRDRRAPAGADQSARSSDRSQLSHTRNRSLSALDFTEYPVDEFHASPPACALPPSVPQSRDQSAAPSPEVDRRSANHPGTRPKWSLVSKLHRLFRRSQSESSSSREPSPSPSSSLTSWRWPAPRRVRRDSKDSKDSSNKGQDL